MIGYGYDDLSRPTLKDLPGTEPDVSYGYDLLGRMISASQPGHTLSFAHDALGRQLSETGLRGTISSAFDLAGRRTRLTWPDGWFVDYDHLVTGELSAIRENGATSGAGVLATFGYDAQGRRTSLTRGNGTATNYAYDAASRLASLSHDMAGTTHDVTYTYGHNPASQILSASRSNDTYAWAGHGSGSQGYGTNGLNQMTAWGSTGVTYDARGNMTADGRDRVFGFSSENLLSSYTRPSTGGAGVFAYDPLMRFTDSNPGTASLRTFFFDGHDIVAEYGAAGQLIVRYVHVPGGADEPLFR